MEKQWYAIRTHVGYEQRVKVALPQKIRERGQENMLGEVVVPTEKVIDLVGRYRDHSSINPSHKN